MNFISGYDVVSAYPKLTLQWCTFVQCEGGITIPQRDLERNELRGFQAVDHAQVHMEFEDHAYCPMALRRWDDEHSICL